MRFRARQLIGVAAVLAVAIVIGVFAFRGGAPSNSPVGTTAATTTTTTNERGIPIGQVAHIHGIAVDPVDPSRLYLATHHGVYRTSPDGATAVQVSQNQNDYMGFSPHPTDHQIIFASGHPVQGGNVGVIVSRDGGRTWQQTSPGANGPVDFHAMTISRADPNVIYGLYRGIQVSRDDGRTWAVAGTPPAQVSDLAASAVSADLIYAATSGGVMVSRDGGRTWEPTGAQGQPATMVETGPDGTVYAFIVGSGLIRAPAAMLAWSPVSNGFGSSVLLHLAVDPDDPNRLFAVDDAGRILASTDAGLNWTTLG